MNYGMNLKRDLSDSLYIVTYFYFISRSTKDCSPGAYNPSPSWSGWLRLLCGPNSNRAGHRAADREPLAQLWWQLRDFRNRQQLAGGTRLLLCRSPRRQAQKNAATRGTWLCRCALGPERSRPSGACPSWSPWAGFFWPQLRRAHRTPALFYSSALWTPHGRPRRWWRPIHIRKWNGRVGDNEPGCRWNRWNKREANVKIEALAAFTGWHLHQPVGR